MGYTWSWGVIGRNLDVFLQGLVYTLFYTVVTVALGMTIGTVLALGRISFRRWLRWPASVLLEVLRGIPLLVLLIWMFYAMPLLTGVAVSAPIACILALSLYGAAYYGEIVRGGILSIDSGQVDAGRSLGMTHGERMRRIVLPQAARRMVPPLMNQSIIMLKNTSLASVITVSELTYRAQALSSTTYRALEVYTTVALFYLAVVIPSSLAVKRLEVKSKSFGSAGRPKGTLSTRRAAAVLRRPSAARRGKQEPARGGKVGELV
ncbi:amino acid ABC transporter permease [Xylanimonas allomyrinae]|uniref:Amino acid ABC transporter permease n=1 Tax=Xylanimonas allomyrinae TaxID=2509459 RepID=A0A4P6EPG0_9MICO|nr:amino acid ABC transporter permease [Xylanimonas allomyrinae]QAY62147.1 amino acid ABC transporter permease [Xylanimonas allomyrinae]